MHTKHMLERAEEWQRRADDLKRRAMRVSENARDGFHEQSRLWAARARSAGESTDRFVHENAWTMVAVVAVAAALIGFLAANRRDYWRL